jgi:hypothetical protein
VDRVGWGCVNEGRCGVCLGNREDLPRGNCGGVRGKLKLCHIGKLKNSWRFTAICNVFFSLKNIIYVLCVPDNIE